MSKIMGTSVPCAERFQWENLGLPVPDLSELDAVFTMQEVKDAVFDSPIDRAPGPDGFSGGFFKTSWNVIKDDLLRALNKFYDLNEPSFNSLNTAFFVLLPKKEAPSQISHYRPISLIHAFAKLVSKILAARLKPRMDELVSPCQSAFITGRSIQDNFLYVQNLAKHYHKTKTPALLLKLDIAKAFDTVSWVYILNMLEARGFPVRYRNWIALLFRTASSKVLINGVPGRIIEHQRGLRQGDSLSPFLFDLVMEPLHRMLDLATDGGVLSKLRGKQCTFRASLYADDVALFINPSQHDIEGLCEILAGFGRATGLITNIAKSSITPISCGNINVEGLATAIGIKVNPFPCNYLGMPLSIKKLTKADWQALLDKVDGFLATWKARLMSKAGRLEMLNSVLTSLAVYLMTINEMPAWVRKEFDRRRRAWLWAGETTCNGGKCRVNWKQVCRPKALGGLGVHCIQAFSAALRHRWMWQKWKKPNKPWAHMKIPMTKKDKALFAAATSIKIGNGETAIFWSDRWLFDQTPAEIAPDIFKISIRKNRTVKDALTNEKWLLDLRHNLDVQHLPQLLRLAQLVEAVQLTNDPDDIIWRFGSKQVYTARHPDPGCVRGLRMREKRGRACSIGERTHEPHHFLDANPPSPLVALSPPAPLLANPPVDCLNSVVPPPSSLYSAVRRALCLYSAVGQLPCAAPRRHAWHEEQMFAELFEEEIAAAAQDEDHMLILACMSGLYTETAIGRCGGSAPGRRKCKPRQRMEGCCMLYADYFADDPLHGEAVFMHRFRMSKKLFLRIVYALREYDSYFRCKLDCTGMAGFSALQKCTVAMDASIWSSW
ncbi:hypothetical protein QYE76_032878 [Lolium multiflorum]|uniref:Reverse transcriptase domain-containing protein n=1 Tax=Lolium multiflorum TaxID=4521 RepID=A0AAD8QVM0_LOLMU|nr:hypothetical protein QYE76_032878 [Lolium multiflorum]